MALRGSHWKKFGVIAALRLFTGLAQFLVILLLTRALTLADVGVYTLLTIYLTYASQVGGFSFYTYFVRIVSGTPRQDLGHLLVQIWAALSVTLAVTAGGVAIMAAVGILSVPYALPFFALLILTVFNTQHENFLVAVDAPIMGALLLLLRSSWVYVALVIHMFGLLDISVNFILQLWIASEILGSVALISYLGYRRMLPISVPPINWPWILRGYLASSKYTILGFLLVLTVSSQRVFLSPYAGEQAVGIFHFYYVISVFGPNLLEATVYAVLLPGIIRSASEQRHKLRPPSLRLVALLFSAGVVGLGVLYLILPFALELLGKAELRDHFSVVHATMGFALLYTVSRSFHYQLYASGADNWILGSYVASAVCGCLSSFLLIPLYGLGGASVSLVVTGVTMLTALCLPFVASLNLSFTGSRPNAG